MTEIKIFTIPVNGDVLVKQYGNTLVEIRANMKESTFTGKLIASIELTGNHIVDQNDVKKIENLFDIFNNR